jgi:hypothetical protein
LSAFWFALPAFGLLTSDVDFSNPEFGLKSEAAAAHAHARRGSAGGDSG